MAAPLAEHLGVRLISKDSIKEALFEAIGIGDWQWSKTLSRAADAAMVEIASGLPSAVLDNYWYAETVEELLAPLHAPMVEVCCRVDPAVAHSRLESRQRHLGHADAENPTQATFTRTFPLGMLGPVVEVDTTGTVDILGVANDVLAALQ